MADTAALAQRAPSQFKQKSRKGKKAWRKNVDVTQVQTGLDDIRDEIIHGGILAERPAEELFTLDVSGEDSIKKDYGKTHKPLKSEEIIAQRSAVPAVDSRKRKSADGIASGSSKRNKNGAYVSYNDLQRLKALANAGAAAPNTLLSDSPAYDPWADAPAPVEPEVPSFLEEKKPIRMPETLSRPPISLASNGKPFAAVKKPQGGKSYNPAFEEWDALLTREGQKEVEAERKRVEEEQAYEERMAKAFAEAAKPEPKEDDNDYESAWESEWEGIQSEADQDSALNKKRPERKTPTERSKIKKRKEAEARAKWEKEQKKREDQENRIKEIARQVAKKERKAKQQQLARADQDSSDNDNDDEEVLRRRALGKNFIPQADLEVVLADELQDSLRALRPEGNLLKDRYRNLMLNGKIEARKANPQHKKPKREVTEKWSYKDWTL